MEAFCFTGVEEGGNCSNQIRSTPFFKNCSPFAAHSKKQYFATIGISCINASP